MKITLLHPSRGRAQEARKAINNWFSKSSKVIQIEYILSIDNDDIQADTYKYIAPKSAVNFKSYLLISTNNSVVEATNKAAEIATGDILIYLSDDFNCPSNWDLQILEAVVNYPSRPWLLKVDDCLQKFTADVLTIPIMSRKLYQKLGYFWHPSYKSMFVDQDLYYVCKNNNWMIMAPHLKFEHMHHCVGKAKKDETYIRSEANWQQGQELYNKRKQQNFPL